MPFFSETGRVALFFAPLSVSHPPDTSALFLSDRTCFGSALASLSASERLLRRTPCRSPTQPIRGDSDHARFRPRPEVPHLRQALPQATAELLHRRFRPAR